MQASVTYWTGVWDPAREAISKEVQAIRGTLAPRSPVVSFSPGQRSAWLARSGVVRLSAKRWVTLRLLAAALEKRGALTHLFGPANAWHLLRAVGRRPVLFTIVANGEALPRELYDKVACFVPETQQLADVLRRAGVADERITLLPPGVDLERFSPAPMLSSAPFRILFASTPSDPADIAPRGIPLLFELARRRPDLQVITLWRSWGDASAMTKAIIDLCPPPNVVIRRGDVSNMAAIYGQVHAVAACFAAGTGKSCPNSIIEGLACGRPAIVSTECGISEEIAAADAGVVAPRQVGGLAAAVDRLQAGYGEHARAARALAVKRFNLANTLSSYRELYTRFS